MNVVPSVGETVYAKAHPGWGAGVVERVDRVKYGLVAEIYVRFAKKKPAQLVRLTRGELRTTPHARKPGWAGYNAGKRQTG